MNELATVPPPAAPIDEEPMPDWSAVPSISRWAPCGADRDLAAVLMAEHGTPAPLAALVALVVGGGCGLFNALCVVRLRINPITS